MVLHVKLAPCFNLPPRADIFKSPVVFAGPAAPGVATAAACTYNTYTPLRQAVKLEPKRKLYRNNLATVLVDMGRTDEAWDELSSVHTPAVAHYNLGYLLYQGAVPEVQRFLRSIKR